MDKYFSNVFYLVVFLISCVFSATEIEIINSSLAEKLEKIGTQIVIKAVGLKKFGEPCNNQTDKCSVGFCSSSFLCECDKTQIYDQTLNSCVQLIGEICKFDHDCVKFGICKPEWNSTEGRFVGKCRCSIKHFENIKEKVCERRARFGEKCNENKPCETGPLIECSNSTSTCECRDKIHQFYDPHKKSCAIRTGHICYDYRARTDFNPCTTNARCNYFFNLMHEGQMPKCQCLEGYLETSEGFCHGGFSKSCNSSSPCNSEIAGLICSDGKCQCDSPLHQIYDEKLGKCANLVGTDCKGENDTTSCITHASCQGQSQNQILYGREVTNKDFTCVCNPGYTRTFGNTCKLDHGQRCIENGNIASGNGHDSSRTGNYHHHNHNKRQRYSLQCNSDSGLACKRGFCKCFDSSLVFDTQKRFCANTEPKGFCGSLNDKKMGIKAMVGCSKGNICSKISENGSDNCICRSSNETTGTYGERCLNYEMIELV